MVSIRLVCGWLTEIARSSSVRTMGVMMTIICHILRRSTRLFPAMAAVCLLMTLPAQAQDMTPDPSSAIELTYGLSVNGTINASTPRIAYRFDGLRGDLVTIDLRVNQGDLDPILTLVDSEGSVVALRDDAIREGSGARDIRLQSLRLPRSDRYFVIVGRFGYQLGTTAGSFSLSVDRLGASSSSGTALRYGDAVINQITDLQPQVYYTFRAQRGDLVSVRMQRMSGDLDSFVQVVNSAGVIIAENDDAIGTGTLDAEIRGVTIGEDGTYVIIASRFGNAAGRSAGTFVLTLENAQSGGLGTSPLAAISIAYGQTMEGEITDSRIAIYYEFIASQGDVITIRMTRLSGTIDAFLSLRDATQREIASNDDSENSQNSLISRFVIPADGRYYIIATRYQGPAGTTTGRYRLQLTREQ